ncbi:MAG: uracil-DNA glycosylase [Candidatus Eremiobacteraeota bacterium]|nr:uracil-DNA glycosylase [Candidatus Eremiobacteraeota bacterium]
MTLARVRRRIVACRRCPELRRYCAGIARVRKREFATQTYWGKPVPSSGPADARLLIVGLAPAAHGGNRTGRMFTGDGSASWLAPALYATGFATQPTSEHRGDGFELVDAFMTAALRCAPPKNKPKPHQIANCADHMRAELALLRRLQVVIGLGKIGFDIAYDRLRERGYAAEGRRRPRFSHGAECTLRAPDKPALTLLGSYHPSRQNTNTGKLTAAMLKTVFARARALLRARAQAA